MLMGKPFPQSYPLPATSQKGIGHRAFAQRESWLTGENRPLQRRFGALKRKMGSICKVRRFRKFFPAALSSAFSGNYSFIPADPQGHFSFDAHFRRSISVLAHISFLHLLGEAQTQQPFYPILAHDLFGQPGARVRSPVKCRLPCLRSFKASRAA
jgi:hypothetical protein